MNSEHRISLTIPGITAEGECERLLDWLIRLAPDYGPVISTNTTSGRAIVTIALEADDAPAAVARAADLVAEALGYADLEPRPVLHVEHELVDAEEAAAV